MTYRALLAIALLSGAACAQVPRSGPAPVRVEIRFQQPMPGADADILRRLSEVSGAEARFAAAVSEREYAYLLACPATDPDCKQALAALASWKPIEWVQVDQLKRIKP